MEVQLELPFKEYYTFEFMGHTAAELQRLIQYADIQCWWTREEKMYQQGYKDGYTRKYLEGINETNLRLRN